MILKIYLRTHVNLMMEKQEETNLIFELCSDSDFYDFSCVRFRTVVIATVYRPHWLRLVNSAKCVIFNANHCFFSVRRATMPRCRRVRDEIKHN